MDQLTKIKDRLKRGEITRFVAIGSSNTESSIASQGCLNWFGWLDIFIRTRYDRINHSINTGIGGNTSDQAMARFERDALYYKPHVLFITLGGNDCIPAKNVSLEKFKENLVEMVKKTREIQPECFIVFQTYYSFDLEWLDWQGQYDRATYMPEYMQAVRDIAAQENVYLFDNYKRWERLRLSDADEFRKMMRDPLHLTPAGNLVWGLDLMRIFDAYIHESLFIRCREKMLDGLRMQKKLDKLEQEAAQL